MSEPKHGHISVFIHGHRSRKTYKTGFSAAYNSWRGMKQRCNNPKADNYKRYGGRGITYDERWESFEVFYNDMGDPPPGYELDRKDPDGPYSFDNCRWLFKKENSGNRRNKRV